MVISCRRRHKKLNNGDSIQRGKYSTTISPCRRRLASPLTTGAVLSEKNPKTSLKMPIEHIIPCNTAPVHYSQFIILSYFNVCMVLPCLGIILWWHISAITCQMIMSTCQLFMLTCQIIMSICQKNPLSYFHILLMPLTAIFLSV